MRYQKTHSPFFNPDCFTPQQGRAERGGCLGLAVPITSCYSVRQISGATHYKHMIIPEDVFFLLPWAFVNVQMSPLLSLPFSLASCHLWILGWSQCQSVKQTWLLLWAILLNLFQKAHGVHLCGEKKSAQNFSALEGFPNISLVSLCISISNSCVRMLDTTCIGSKTLLLVCHALRVKYFKIWYWIFCLNDTKVGLILWFIFCLFVCLVHSSIFSLLWDIL